jgi:hypothetical protein
MAQQLTNLKLKFVSCVPDGANQLADIVLAKRNSVETNTKGQHMAENEVMKQEPVVDIEKRIAEAVSSAVAAATEPLKKQLEDSKAEIEKSKAEIEKAQAAANVERDARETLEFGKHAERELANLPGTTAEKGKVLKSIAHNLPSDEREELMKLLRAGNAAMAKNFSAVGASGTGDGNSAEAKLEALAKKRASEKNERYGVAYAAVLESTEGKKLYELAKAEKRGVN